LIRHAGLVALRLGGRWAGALIEGPSGVGKSDLAIRALELGFRLAADDRTLVWASGGRLYGRAPGPLAGLIEVRGQGVMGVSQIALAEIVLQGFCVSQMEMIERMPDPETAIIAGIALPRLVLRPKEASAPAKLRRAIEYLGAAVQQAYQATSLGGHDRAGTGETP
jgi:serine kinase of HPr protein (carbohydrate metabolism regulator)